MKRAPASFSLLLVSLSACATGTARDGYVEDVQPTAPAEGTDGGRALPGASTTGAIAKPTPPVEQTPEEREAELIHEVFGHSATELFRLDPTTKAVRRVGAFAGCEPVSDIALNEAGELYAVSKEALYTVDKATAACAKLHDGAYPNSLAFVPKGALDANEEALVGYDGADYVRVDLTTGATTTIGKLNAGSGVQSSGDVVSVKGGKTFLTVKGGACSRTDCLYEVDPKTGKKLRDWGSIEHAKVFGLAFWAGKLYGFDAGGNLFEVTFGTSKIVTTTIDVPNRTADLSFWGAGSSTSAPLVETPK